VPNTPPRRPYALVPPRKAASRPARAEQGEPVVRGCPHPSRGSGPAPRPAASSPPAPRSRSALPGCPARTRASPAGRYCPRVAGPRGSSRAAEDRQRGRPMASGQAQSRRFARRPASACGRRTSTAAANSLNAAGRPPRPAAGSRPRPARSPVERDRPAEGDQHGDPQLVAAWPAATR
jgi:hypothetical protein